MQSHTRSLPRLQVRICSACVACPILDARMPLLYVIVFLLSPWHPCCLDSPGSVSPFFCFWWLLGCPFLLPPMPSPFSHSHMTLSISSHRSQTLSFWTTFPHSTGSLLALVPTPPSSNPLTHPHLAASLLCMGLQKSLLTAMLLPYSVVVNAPMSCSTSPPNSVLPSLHS